MKKIILMSVIACLGLFAVSCKNQPKEEATPAQEAVEAVNEAANEAVQVTEDAAKKVGDALEEAGEAVKDAAEKTAEEIKK